VAMLVHEPGRTRGLRITTPVQLSDLAETVIGAALGRGPSAWGPNSRDLLELAAETEEKRVVFVQCREADPEIRDLLRRSADPSLRHRAQGQVAAADESSTSGSTPRESWRM
jgi:hypothetical protein